MSKSFVEKGQEAWAEREVESIFQQISNDWPTSIRAVIFQHLLEARRAGIREGIALKAET